MGKLKQTKLSEIKPYERNPRMIPQAAIDAVARSITAYGFRQPIVVDGDGVILAGHTRYLAAKQLELTSVPVLWETDITPEQARGYRIADNKTGELAAWDRDMLDEEVRALAAEIDDASLDALGIADWELKRIFNEQVKPLSPSELDAMTAHASTSWTPRVTSSGSTHSDATPAPAATAEPFTDAVEASPGAVSSPVVVRVMFPDARSADAARDKLREIAEMHGGSIG